MITAAIFSLCIRSSRHLLIILMIGIVNTAEYSFGKFDGKGSRLQVFEDDLLSRFAVSFNVINLAVIS